MRPRPVANVVGQSASRLASLVRAGEISPEEIIEAHLERISAIDPQLGAFQCLRQEKALAEARALKIRQDLHTLPLAGVPVAVKENVPVAGEPMRIGSRATPSGLRDADHPAVRRLRAAGGVIVGTTRVPELCVWGTTDSTFGITRNPWDPERTPGGSSGGSAAAVASAMVPLALGADGMGSIRIPSASCGVIGLKPGPEVVPCELGRSAWYGMAENGPIATNVVDLALMLSVLAARLEFRDPVPPERALRIAVATRSPLPGVAVDRQFEGAVLETANLLAGAGHEVEEAAPPPVPFQCMISTIARWTAGVAEDAADLDFRQLEARTRTHVRLGRIARRLGLIVPPPRERWRRLLEPFFRRFDLLVTPVLARAPRDASCWSQRSWVANAWADARFAPFTAAWNFAAYPAAAIPAGLHSDGMPLSVQVVAAAGGESLILSVARQLEALRPWPRHAEIRTPAL